MRNVCTAFGLLGWINENSEQCPKQVVDSCSAEVLEVCTDDWKILFGYGDSPNIGQELLCDDHRLLRLGCNRCLQAVRQYPSEEPHLDSGALLLLSSPRRGGEGGEALDGNVSNTWQDGGQVVADRNLHPAAALHDRQNRRHLRSGLLAADVDPVLPAQRHGTHRVLRQIVAQLQFRVLQEACELLPQGERVVCRLPQRARR